MRGTDDQQIGVLVLGELVKPATRRTIEADDRLGLHPRRPPLGGQELLGLPAIVDHQPRAEARRRRLPVDVGQHEPALL